MLQNSFQSYFMIFSYAVLFIGVLSAGFGWFLFKIRALRNRRAWDGLGGKLMKFGFTLVIIGIILLGISLFLLSK